jgi:hypothetical protein
VLAANFIGAEVNPDPSKSKETTEYGHREDKGGPHAPGNHFILSSSQQNIIRAEVIADGLTVDDCSKGAAEVAQMITFMAAARL